MKAKAEPVKTYTVELANGQKRLVQAHQSKIEAGVLAIYMRGPDGPQGGRYYDLVAAYAHGTWVTFEVTPSNHGDENNE